METIKVRQMVEVPQCGKCQKAATPLYLVWLDSVQADPKNMPNLNTVFDKSLARTEPRFRCEVCQNKVFAAADDPPVKRTRKPAAGGSSDG